jgi:hypothetical protein
VYCCFHVDFFDFIPSFDNNILQHHYISLSIINLCNCLHMKTRAIVKCRVKPKVQVRVYKNKGPHKVDLIVGLIPVNLKPEGFTRCKTPTPIL